jgi:glycosyltransferase involved in cell wall biosynthesis
MEPPLDIAQSAPRVSIIIATYNRSNVLALVLRTVLWQTVTDWEVLVVGDKCTDDTAEVVARFADPRIQFINLPENCGDQSGPNNFGAARARGKFIAWLNHDDFWLPDHLERTLQQLETTEADLVFTLCERITAESVGTVVNAAPHGRYDPIFLAPASCWVLRRELFDAVGPWRAAREMFLIPSQDWLFRAHRAGKKINLCPHLTIAAIASDKTAGSYAKREMTDHATLFARLAAPDTFRTEELTRQLIDGNPQALKSHSFQSLFRELLKRIWSRSWLALGVHPGSVHYALRTRRRGGAFVGLRKRRGLPPK